MTSNTADESEELSIALLNGIDKAECSETLSRLARRLKGEARACVRVVMHADVLEDMNTLKMALSAQGAKRELALRQRSRSNSQSPSRDRTYKAGE